MSDLPQDGPGAELKTAREGMDVSTREVADALNLPVHVIEALEADDFERLPPTVFTRGYLRSYARLLELSPDALLARYPEVTEEVDAITGELPAAELPAGLPARTLGIAAAVSLVLIVLLVFLLGDEDAAPDPEVPVALDQEAEAAEPTAELELTQPSVDRPSVEAVEVDSTPSLPATVTREDPPAEVVLEEPAAAEVADAEPREVDPGELVSAPSTAAPSSEDPAPSERATASSEDPASAETASTEPTLAEPLPAVAPSFRERRITEFGDDKVTMVFSEDCWVEVKSADGENLYSDLNRTGRTLVLTGRAPFRILLGYAPGVTLSFNGEPVPLERYSRNNVANLVLGE